ncbi:asparagine synthase (glutamine-hydrolyzing) [Catenovulum sp. 2E275]|uniref:asparagine synthase (glutamine-hydrolyzing) n=1 Tax=Catenovulum sp. 2E275 TaxID=2980497 RepID=UPI0021CFF139|nr:asparagine synthase (glutamine-hydrolyzing) [Catenovulum sp. 2E275]MCU4675558.1 asparagine synthase (glutamine-hydrolyzing) [Catenovulum sp. 2E275]
MCGIAGFTSFQTEIGNQDTLQQMGQAIFHRGPDAGGEYLDNFVGLCHRRLSIIDLSSAGTQPMYSNNGNYIIVFNGEIYNFVELRQHLEELGYQFNTHTDTEVLLALFQEYGIKLLEKINGMYAFAIWDKSAKQLFVARDRIGKKPLYYTHHHGEFVFASELKSLLKIDGIKKSLRLDSVYDFFAYQYVPDPKTIFNDIFKLPPAHYALISNEGTKIEQYWDISFAEQINDAETSIKQKLKQVLNDATKKRMLADVPLGAFLSGGVDSSGVVAMMAKNSSTPITTCSIGFDEKRFNETEFAKIVADKYQTNHHELTVHQNVSENLEHIVSFFDEPFADPSLVPTFFVSQLAREKVTVAIAGDGGDEVFAGYSKYAIDHIENKLRDKFPSAVRKYVFPRLSKICGQINLRPLQKASSLLHSLSLEPAMGFYITNSFIKQHDWDKLVNQETKESLLGYHPSQLTLDTYAKCDGKDHLSKVLYTDMKTFLPGDILVKVDRMSMANSLEVRAPILDYELMEFAAKIPSQFKFNEGEKKYILKEAFLEDLPEDILYRKKMGFSVPLASWLRGELKTICEEKLIQHPHGLTKIFNADVIKQMWDEHVNEKKDNSTLLWSMLMFQMWWDRYMAV